MNQTIDYHAILPELILAGTVLLVAGGRRLPARQAEVVVDDRGGSSARSRASDDVRARRNVLRFAGS